ncbi:MULTISPECIES: hypothetical protein [unclassified Paenibacillus]|uniref:Uncharacterized protein n=1 Tax=Paenibacillus provencensis TaxID=441151 RepID=A0ABW3PYS6_9BACL|nr:MULTISPECIES: hypothetical protein [unclassified Paenibacillus]MCM3130599.1 hypothetical protein [Paenibacillus sp. MER 78]SDX74846.1 hypothetical protein SAMN05518848_11375 [Paenibacillus sp. PDC88]SFS90008.1 hypothetical protein SAMN04488601_106195 [Paenibacillus sp. 453mf]
MWNYFEKVFGLILALALMFIWPISNSLNKQDDISEIVVLNSVTQFVDSVRDKGFITPTMYNQFSDQLTLTGNTYDIQMEHLHKRYDPIYSDAGEFLGGYNVNYEGFYNAQINEKLFPRTSTDGIDHPNRVYKLAAGDFFNVTVKNTNRTAATLINDILTNTINSPNSKIVIPYGGMVLNEDY